MPRKRKPTDYGLSSTISLKDKRQKRWAKQRRELGFDETELWNLDCTIAKFLVPRLKAFRKSHAGIPGALENEPERWNEILDAMIEGFELYDAKFHRTREECRKVNKALRLLVKWFGCLWS